jgi:hypothetical protein
LATSHSPVFVFRLFFLPPTKHPHSACIYTTRFLGADDRPAGAEPRVVHDTHLAVRLRLRLEFSDGFFFLLSLSPLCLLVLFLP